MTWTCLQVYFQNNFIDQVYTDNILTYQFLQENTEYQMEYHRYLKEVVQALESDPEFRAKLEKANEDDIRVSLILRIININ